MNSFILQPKVNEHRQHRRILVCTLAVFTQALVPLQPVSWARFFFCVLDVGNPDFGNRRAIRATNDGKEMNSYKSGTSSSTVRPIRPVLVWA